MGQGLYRDLSCPTWGSGMSWINFLEQEEIPAKGGAAVWAHAHIHHCIKKVTNYSFRQSCK